jgi:hypothetical protein
MQFEASLEKIFKILSPSIKQTNKEKVGVVAHTYHPGYMGSVNRRNYGPGQPWHKHETQFKN